MNEAATAQELRRMLHQALAALPLAEECILLDYPNYYNSGDHMIWAGEILYLAKVRGVRVHFSLRDAPPSAPILLQGGGNFGDLWPQHQLFREDIVRRYPNRPIIVFPQTIYFQSEASLRRAAAVFNSHPDLTLCARCARTFEIAQQHFSNCRLILSPDIAFELANWMSMPPPEPSGRGLYHCRTDPEQPPGAPASQIGLTHLEMDDWISLRRHVKPTYWETQPPLRIPKALVRWLVHRCREGARSPERASLTAWTAGLQPVDARTRQSLRFIHASAYQFLRYNQIVTNRLHGHILAVMLGIPNVLLPNTYYKNESFHRTWSSAIPFARFVDPAKESVSSAIYRVTSR